MNNIMKRAGFTAIEAILVVIVVGIIGLLGYTFWNAYQDSEAGDAAGTSEEAVSSDEVEAAPAISSTDDLDEAMRVLDETDVEASSDDSSKLDNESSDF